MLLAFVDRRAEDERHEVGGVCVFNAPPFAVVATKSSGPPSVTGFELEPGRVFGSDEMCGTGAPLRRRPGGTRGDKDESASRRVSVGRSARSPPDAAVRPPCPVPTTASSSYARLTVRVGLNLQPGQTLGVNALIEHAPLARAITREAYWPGAGTSTSSTPTSTSGAPTSRRGRRPARLVAALARRAPARPRRDRAARSARSPATRSPSCSPISTASGSARRADAGGRRGSPSRSPTGSPTGRSSPSRTRAGRRRCSGEPDVERLWEAVGHAVRLDQPDPVTAWREHIGRLESRAPRSRTSARSTVCATADRAPT